MQSIFTKMDNINRLHAIRAYGDWKKYIGLPYGESYEIAYNRFESTLAAAEKARAKRIDMAVLALTICGGTLLTAVLANSAKTALARAAIGAIGTTAIGRSFSALGKQRVSAAVDYLVAGVHSATSTQLNLNISAALKNDIEKSVAEANTNAINVFQPGSSPLTLTRRIDHFLNSSSDSLGGMASKYKERLDLSLEDKGRIYKGMIYSEFLTPPTQNPYSNPIDLQDSIELTLYLQLLLNTDSQGGKTIEKSPSEADYPQTQLRQTSRGMRSVRGTEIRYARVEKPVTERINELYQKLPGNRGQRLVDHTVASTLWGTRMDRGSLLKAEAALHKLNLASNNQYGPENKTKRKRLVIDTEIDRLVEGLPIANQHRFG